MDIRCGVSVLWRPNLELSWHGPSTASHNRRSQQPGRSSCLHPRKANFAKKAVWPPALFNLSSSRHCWTKKNSRALPHSSIVNQRQSNSTVAKPILSKGSTEKGPSNCAAMSYNPYNQGPGAEAGYGQPVSVSPGRAEVLWNSDDCFNPPRAYSDPLDCELIMAADAGCVTGTA